MRIFSTVVLLLVSSLAIADSYMIYMPTDAEFSQGDPGTELFITNMDSKTVTTTDLDPFITRTRTNSYSGTFGSESAELNLTLLPQNRFYQDIKGSVLTIRENSVLVVTKSDGNLRYYGRIIGLNITTGAIDSEVLIASNQADYDFAIANGHEAILEDANTDDMSGRDGVTLKTYSQNITNSGDDAAVATQGNFSTNLITAADGSSLMRQEDDGTIHLGDNSVVIAPSTDGGTTPDMIYSSAADGSTLQIGNISGHHTIIKGTAEITGSMDMNSNRITDLGTPINSSDAATKGYVDSLVGNSVSQQYVDGIAALSSAISIMPKASAGKTMLTAGTGYLNGESALALGLSSRPVNSPVSFNFAASHNSTVSKTVFAAGVGWEF